jgi:hypothetical protein
MEVPKGQFVCPICGIDLRDWNPDKLRCPICRSLYPQGTKFCLKDGSPLEQAIVDFDSEATIFLSGSIKAQKPTKDDIIPKLKFSDDRDRAFPKLDRDQKGHLAPPPPPPKPVQPVKKAPPPETFSYTPTAEPELEMPEITIDPTPHVETPIKTSPQPVVEPQKSPLPIDPFPDTRFDHKSSTRGPYLRVKPLEEYERLLREENEKRLTLKTPQLDTQKLRLQLAKQQRPGFFKRLISAIKVLLGK